MTSIAKQLAADCPDLWNECCSIVAALVPSLKSDLEAIDGDTASPKIFNDPVWGSIQLEPHEVVLNDSPLVQRLSGVRQLGLSCRVYPGAGHSRLDHTRGVLEASQRIVQALDISRLRRKAEMQPTAPHPRDLASIRLAALLHDCGHGPFSHVTEEAMEALAPADFAAARQVLGRELPPAIDLSPAEILSIIFVLSSPMTDIFAALSGFTGSANNLAEAVAARIAGSSEFLYAKHLRSVISGTIDADKLDYMARDCHYSGLPLGMDVRRILAMIEVAERPKDGRLELGLAKAGIGAYEQMVVARVLLYDRLYYHHKVRAAEEMVKRCLFDIIKQNHLLAPSGSKLKLRHFFLPIHDDTFLLLLAGMVKADAGLGFGAESFPNLPPSASSLPMLVHNRCIHKRSFAIAARYDERISPKEEYVNESPSLFRWTRLKNDLSTQRGRTDFAQKIYNMCIVLSGHAAMSAYGNKLRLEDILVDFPSDSRVVFREDLLVRSADGVSEAATLFFSPSKWARAYEERKHQAFVFAPERYSALVSFATRIIVFDLYGLYMGKHAAKASKMPALASNEWIEGALECGACSPDYAEAERSGGSYKLHMLPDDITLTEQVSILLEDEDGNFRKSICRDLRTALPEGFSEDTHTKCRGTLALMLGYLTYTVKMGTFAKIAKLTEAALQADIRKYLEIKEVSVEEATRAEGGTTDLSVNSIFIENKVIEDSIDPFASQPNAGYQLRCYSLTKGTRLGIVMLGYRAPTAGQIGFGKERAKVIPRSVDGGHFAEIRLLIPYGYGVPSRASPKKPSSRKLPKSRG